MNKKRLISGMMAGVFALQLVGCATIPEAIEYRQLYTNYKMSDTIFLDITKKAKYKNVYVDVRNTSQLQEVNPEALKQVITEKLRAKGYNVISDPTSADYILQVNILYFDYYRKTAAKEGAVEGALVGGLAGGLAGERDVEALILAALGAGAGYLGGALIGSAIKIETFAGVVDIQIMEKADNPVVGKIITQAKQGTSTTLQTEQTYQSQYQTYRTKLAVTATQTNLKRDVASQEVTEKLSQQIAGIF
ncbi:MAG: hypothetical protein PWQ78_919 [Petrotoga sp.]|nr:hypothetical protein [Petrotoga sp.]